jgi:mannose-6-phosphate isomerase-like protein (cupin superfamily)
MSLEVLTNPVTGETMRVLESNAEVFKIQYDLELGGAVPAVHFHPHQTQIISVIEGELHCQAGDRIVVLRPGESVEIPPRTIHTQWNPTETTAVAIEELRPALRTHNLFRVMFALARDGIRIQRVCRNRWSARLFSQFSTRKALRRVSGCDFCFLFSNRSADCSDMSE